MYPFVHCELDMCGHKKAWHWAAKLANLAAAAGTGLIHIQAVQVRLVQEKNFFLFSFWLLFFTFFFLLGPFFRLVVLCNRDDFEKEARDPSIYRYYTVWERESFTLCSFYNLYLALQKGCRGIVFGGLRSGLYFHEILPILFLRVQYQVQNLG